MPTVHFVSFSNHETGFKLSLVTGATSEISTKMTRKFVQFLEIISYIADVHYNDTIGINWVVSVLLKSTKCTDFDIKF